MNYSDKPTGFIELQKYYPYGAFRQFSPALDIRGRSGRRRIGAKRQHCGEAPNSLNTAKQRDQLYRSGIEDGAQIVGFLERVDGDRSKGSLAARAAYWSQGRKPHGGAHRQNHTAPDDFVRRKRFTPTLYKDQKGALF